MKLILLILLTACSTAPQKEPAQITVKPVPVVSLVNVLSTTNFTEKEKEKLAAYIPVMNNTIASKCFSDFLTSRNMIKTSNKTAEQVIHDLRTRQVEVHLIAYYKRFSKVHGYTYPDVNKIWLNRKYHSSASLCSEASNLGHELSHKLGYGHNYKATQSRPFSVPYTINAAFTFCCK